MNVGRHWESPAFTQNVPFHNKYDNTPILLLQPFICISSRYIRYEYRKNQFTPYLVAQAGLFHLLTAVKTAAQYHTVQRSF